MERIFSGRELRRLILPLIFEQALAVTVGMADTAMVSSVGEVAVSGVSLVDMLNNLIFSVFAALATGGAVVVSQLMGAERMDKARGAARQLLFTVTVISSAVTALVLLLRRPLLTLLFGKIEQDVMGACLVYLEISALSFPFLGIYNACAALFRCQNRSDLTFKVSAVGNLINVAGNALCLFGLKMGVAGVALPTLISRVFMALCLYFMLRQRKGEVYLGGEKFSPDLSAIKRILYIGVPGGIENGIFQLGRVMVVSIISGFGTAQIAANGVANSLDSVGIITGHAMNLAMVTVIGRCVGAGDGEQVRYYTKKLMAITYISMAAVNIPLLLSLNGLLSLFGLGEEARGIAYILVMIHNGVGMFLWPLSFTLPNMLRACNDVKYPMVCSILSMWIFRIGFSVVLGVHFRMGAVGVWIAMVLDWICRVACFILRYFRLQRSVVSEK